MSADPAYHIPLSDTELKQIGEICAIQGQIEYLLQTIVRRLLNVKRELALAILGSTSIGTNADIFIKVVREKCGDPEVLRASELAYAAIADLSKGRNDFVHALYARATGGKGFSLSGGDALPILENIVAVRTKTQSQRKVSDIQLVRDQAARVSCALAYASHQLLFAGDEHNPWRGKF